MNYIIFSRPHFFIGFRKLIILLWLVQISLIAYVQNYDWLNTARIFLIDAYQPPFAPKLEFNPEKLAQTMQEMHANTVRMSTMGKYATVQGIRFSTHPDQGNRDLLAEMIAAAKPRSIKVIPYISTGHKLAWSIVTRDYPDYAQRTSPGGGPRPDHMNVGEEMGAVCWNTSYRQAYMDYVTHIVRDYDIDGIYFDTWVPFYFWPGMKICYCDGCVRGFRKDCGLEIPWHEKEKDYTPEELQILDKYHHWYHEKLVLILQDVRKIIKSFKDIPLIYNINDPDKIAREDPRIISNMDAFLYERGGSMLERAEGLSLAKTLGIKVMPYIGGYDNWPRIVNNRYDFQQEIFTTLMFGGAPIVSQPYPYIDHKENREFVSFPFRIIADHEKLFSKLENEPYVAVVYSSFDPKDHAKAGWWWKADARSATRGAFAACLYAHIQVTSAMISLLDNPEKMARYKVIFLADNVALTAPQINNLMQYVSDGGGLIASYATSLYAPGGERCASFGLEELIRVRPVELSLSLVNYQAMVGGPNDLYLLKRKGSSVPGTEWNEELVPAWYFQPVEVMEGGKVIMDIVTGDDTRAVLPGVVLSGYGKGKVLYCASSVESLYDSNGNPVLQDLIAGFISVVSSSPAPYIIKGPPCLIANLTRSSDSYVIHLANWTGNIFEKNHMMTDTIIDIHDVSIRFAIPEKRKVNTVECLTGSTCSVAISKDMLSIRLPHVGAYEGIVITLK